MPNTEQRGSGAMPSKPNAQEINFWKEQAELYKIRYESEQHLLTQLLRSKADVDVESGLNTKRPAAASASVTDAATAVTFATNSSGGSKEGDEEQQALQQQQKVYVRKKPILKKDPPSSRTLDTYNNPPPAMQPQIQTQTQQETSTLGTPPLPLASITTDDNNTFHGSAGSNGKVSPHQHGGSKLRFNNINFVVGGKKNTKNILTRVNGTVSHGHVLAIMGPSGAGKTTLINALTLDTSVIGRRNKITGSVTLNGKKLTGSLFKKHCFVVKQQDKHWPYLSVRETLQYAAGLYDVASAGDIPMIVDKMIRKMGMVKCADDTRCANLSGGQKRRLSIAVALLKKPTVLFLDEPTSGLDAAAASSIMSEIGRVAKEENLVVACTIHQPSTKVFNGFDQVMILSRGREAFHGGHRDAIPYFTEIGYPLPEETNPAEHFLDLVNSDFSGEQEVLNILDEWENRQGDPNSIHYRNPKSNHYGDSGDQVASSNATLQREIMLMFHRHFTLIIRDPVLYAGRTVIFLVMNLIFSLVYLSARQVELDQVYNRLWIQIWFIAVPLNMGVVAVYALNDEFKSIQRESHNGMSRPSTYILAKTLLVMPLFFVFAASALLIPSFAIQGIPWSGFFESIILYAATMFMHESVAEMLSVLFDDPIMGMLAYTAFWFAGFLFGGFLISPEDLYWPFKLFYYIMPLAYYIRSIMYITIMATDWGGANMLILSMLNSFIPVVQTENTVWRDIFTLFGFGIVYKIIYIVLVVTTCRKVAKIKSS